MAFRRPGSKSSSAFGVKFDIDRDSREQQEPSPAVLTGNDNLGLEEQRRRLPIAALRLPLLYAVEKHSTVVVLGETG
jgi:HrpA-like RNA helicase